MDKRHRAQLWDIWWAPLLIWGTLAGLLAATCAMAYIPLGAFNLALSLAIAAVKCALIGIVFMRLRNGNSLHWLAAGAGPIWVLIMFLLTGADYFTR